MSRFCRLVKRNHDLIFLHFIAFIDADFPDSAVSRSFDDILHLHGFQHQDRVALLIACPSATATLSTRPGIGALMSFTFCLR